MQWGFRWLHAEDPGPGPGSSGPHGGNVCCAGSAVEDQRHPLTVAPVGVEADPDAILVAPCGFDLARTRAEMPSLAARPGWNELRAVREGRVFLGDGNAFFNRPGPRVVETLEIVAEMLHPEAYRFGHAGTGWERYAERPG